MIHTKITFEDGSLPELMDKVVHKGELYAVAGLSGGMASGKPSVEIVIELPDGSMVIAETSLLIFQSVAAAMKGRYGVVD